ncbi:hypothetical protein M431DRAFT_514598 [Trichoderma harzianum CBS 226.95]|uniref:Uncharacterized protein n=1 Tax=Trichoderma harzianum CBS 226.95 TaxID=983964 RepID=A0A2T4ASU1_TRIHA|nr:hypothetical protein M431DRAFT_514598 [Trichoderma harzianum CBS 226.95]PTB60109.1 hypothetical protein M431DRAFT_514598 [Trichoderma harzianum CBS 226.95]
MANNQNLFFYAPTWDYPPNGPIKLGNVITSVKKPERPLHCVPPSDSDIFSTKKMSFEHTKDQLQNQRFSILVRFFSIFGLNVRVSTGRETSKENKFSFKTVETTQFVPTSSYIQSCVENDDVRRYLQISRYRKPLYVITGLKIVTGVDANMHTSHAVQSSPAIQIDSTIPQIGPISFVGSGAENTASTKAVTAFKNSDDFVFAFRVSKVLVSKGPDQVISEEDYRRGAMLGTEEEQQRIKSPPLSILKVEYPDAEAEGFDAEELTEGEEVVVCAVPRETNDA